MLKFLTAKSHNVTSNFSLLNWNDLIQRVENPPNLGAITTKQAKAKSAIIAATDAPDKRKETILKHDNFTLLRVDLDNTHFDLASIVNILESMGFESFLTHTTASHQQEDNGNRFRVYIELAESVNYETWAILEAYLCFLFRSDDCAARPQQIMYLPVRFDGDNYEFHIREGRSFKASSNQFLKDAAKFHNEQQIKQQQDIKNIATLSIKPAIQENLLGKQVSIIDLLNQHYAWPELLTNYGYVRQGKAWLPPESTSKTAGVYILQSPIDGRERYFSHHESDPCATGKAIDQFDFIAIREFAGDTKLALKEIAARFFPEVDRYNKREWAILQHNQKAQQLFSGVRS